MVDPARAASCEYKSNLHQHDDCQLHQRSAQFCDSKPFENPDLHGLNENNAIPKNIFDRDNREPNDTLLTTPYHSLPSANRETRVNQQNQAFVILIRFTKGIKATLTRCILFRSNQNQAISTTSAYTRRRSLPVPKGASGAALKSGSSPRKYSYSSIIMRKRA